MAGQGAGIIRMERGGAVASIEPEGYEFNDADLAALNARAGQGVMHGLAAQAIMGCAAALVSWVVAGSAAGLSALAGAAAYFVPNALFALRLLLGAFGARRPNPLTFFLGEAFKLGLAVLLLWLAADLGRTWLVWPAFLLGLLCVLKGYVLLFAFRGRR
jgi:ATP synthase protein I